jgi:hypothetical protein
MQKLFIPTLAISLLMLAAGCSSNSQTVQQREACTSGDPHPWCMQLAQTRPLGSTNGPEATGPNNPEMRDDYPPYPTNPALRYNGPGPTTLSGSAGYSGLGSIGGLGSMGGMH